jgi:SAM-dependent methyltransferase
MGDGRRALLRRAVPPLMRPGWPDEARRLLQEPLFREAVGESPPHGRCLNAGSGEGLYSRFLESFDAITEIVNFDIELPQISSRRNDPRHSDVQGSVAELPFADGSFDFVLCTEVIEHVEDDGAVAHEFGRVLVPGGIALISVPTPPAPPDPLHVREGYSLQALSHLLAQGGLEVSWHAYCFHLPMRWLLPVWRWQYERLGRGRRSLMPRFVVLAFAYADRWLHVGRPWDVVVLARRGGSPAQGADRGA